MVTEIDFNEKSYANQQKERKELFSSLAAMKLKAGEKICTSLFKKGAKEPSFVISQKGQYEDVIFTLYSVTAGKLDKLQTAATVATLEAAAIPKLK